MPINGPVLFEWTELHKGTWHNNTHPRTHPLAHTTTPACSPAPYAPCVTPQPIYGPALLEWAELHKGLWDIHHHLINAITLKPDTLVCDAVAPRRTETSSQPDMGASSGAPAALGDSAGLRDPRRVNNVADNEYTPAMRNEHDADLANERWANEAPSSVENVKIGELYLVKIDAYEGEYALGLASVDSCEKAGDQRTWTISWFLRSGWKSKVHVWGPTPRFEHHMVYTNTRQRLRNRLSGVTLQEFRVHVTDHDLTEAGLKVRQVPHPPFPPPLSMPSWSAMCDRKKEQTRD